MMRAMFWVMAIAVAGSVMAALPGIDVLTREADRAWRTDVKRWGEYSFDREVTRKSYDKKGKVTSRQDLHFRVTPVADGFEEKLLEIDGRQPTSGEVKDHAGKGIFSKHYRQAEELNLENPLGEDLALLGIVQAQEHRLVGEEKLDGTPCYRTSFEARPDPGGPVRERLKYAVKGSACFSTEGYHLVHFEMETVRALSKSPITMNKLHMTIEGQPVGDAWVPKIVKLRSDVEVFGKRLRKSNTWRYSEFRSPAARKP